MNTLLWITLEDGTVTGPHGIAYLRRELDQGSITLDTLAAQEGTEDWMPLETWGQELYPKEQTRRTPYATKVASYVEPPKKTPFLSALGILIGFCGIIYFVIFFDISVDSDDGKVVNLGKMNDRLVGIIASVGTTALAVIVDVIQRRK